MMVVSMVLNLFRSTGSAPVTNNLQLQLLTMKTNLREKEEEEKEGEKEEEEEKEKKEEEVEGEKEEEENMEEVHQDSFHRVCACTHTHTGTILLRSQYCDTQLCHGYRPVQVCG